MKRTIVTAMVAGAFAVVGAFAVLSQALASGNVDEVLVQPIPHTDKITATASGWVEVWGVDTAPLLQG
jgi:hypothetical protein